MACESDSRNRSTMSQSIDDNREPSTTGVRLRPRTLPIIAITQISIILVAAYFILRVDQKFIDLNTAESLTRQQLLGFTIQSRIENTPFSERWGRKLSPDTSNRRWKQVWENTWFNRISPHFRHHGSAFNLKFFVEFIEFTPLPSDCEDAWARKLFDALYRDDPYLLTELTDNFAVIPESPSLLCEPTEK